MLPPQDILNHHQSDFFIILKHHQSDFSIFLNMQYYLHRSKSSYLLLQSRNGFEFLQVLVWTVQFIMHWQCLYRHLVFCSSLELSDLVLGASNRLSRSAHSMSVLGTLPCKKKFCCCCRGRWRWRVRWRVCSLVNRTYAVSIKRL